MYLLDLQEVATLRYLVANNNYCICILQDVDECAFDNGGCTQICSNNNRYFECLCNTGYILMADNINCIGKFRVTSYSNHLFGILDLQYFHRFE